jgi:hypothetical protein
MPLVCISNVSQTESVGGENTENLDLSRSLPLLTPSREAISRKGDDDQAKGKHSG